jgi:hypothetical protein
MIQRAFSVTSTYTGTVQASQSALARHRAFSRIESHPSEPWAIGRSHPMRITRRCDNGGLWTPAGLLRRCEQHCATPVARSGNPAGGAFKSKATPKADGSWSRAFRACERAAPGVPASFRNTATSSRRRVTTSRAVLTCQACCGSRSRRSNCARRAPNRRALRLAASGDLMNAPVTGPISHTTSRQRQTGSSTHGLDLNNG